MSGEVHAAEALTIADGLDGDGFAVVRGAVDSDYCLQARDAVVNEYSRLTKLGWKFGGAGHLAGHLNFTPAEYGPGMLAKLRAGGYVAAVEKHLGSRLVVMGYGGNMNLPRSRPQEFHQDWRPPTDYIVLNVVLTETTVANGATEFLPGTQADRYDYRSLYSSGVVDRVQSFTGEPGDLLIRWGSLWHRGTSNRSEVPRPMFYIIMREAEAAEVDPPCTDPIGFYDNRLYGNGGLLQELMYVYAARLIRFKRKLNPPGIRDWRKR